MKSLRPLPLRLPHEAPPLLLLQSAACSGSADNSSSLQVVTLAAILPLTNTEYAWAWPRVAPALYLAVRQVNSDPELLSSLVLRLVHRSSEPCGVLL
ncbi:Atrial natriuretic peptide receptor 1 [Dissostichus eleginoides]|uniref:Atrial natriuretic peptide receptor 1 n=1 Tax=Dissostichus eleginoides TaxID=100907 RepID=A0AAD9B4T8_DISEL|nr:Atrial natriuretic peptide receptor 1 [Dissostichus eleginoides]